MELSRQSRSKLETFINESLEDEIELPEIIVFSKTGAKLLTTILGVSGITLGKFIFVRPNIGWRDEMSRLRFPSELIAHEIAHVLQYRRDGFLNFLTAYIGDYLRIFRQKKRWNLRTHFEAYSQIPHEIEAREFAEEFRLWCEFQNGNSRSDHA